MKKKKMTKGERRKAKKQLIKNSWEEPNAKREVRNKREKIAEEKKIRRGVKNHIQALEFVPDISFEEEVFGLKKIRTRMELGEKHKEFLNKMKEFKGNNHAVLHYSNLAKEVRKLIDE